MFDLTRNTGLTLPVRQESDGRLLVGESRIPLESVLYAFLDGATPEEISYQFPALRLPEIYSSITFYLQNGPELEAYLSEREAVRSRVREENEKRFPAEGIRQRLLARKRIPVG